jgi:outer membrane protein assembly factor BamB
MLRRFFSKLLGYGITTGTDESIYITGYTSGNLDGKSNKSRYGDAFIANYNSDGSKTWTQLLGFLNGGEGKGITTGSDGSIYIAGHTSDNGALATFIAKYSKISNLIPEEDDQIKEEVDQIKEEVDVAILAPKAKIVSEAATPLEHQWEWLQQFKVDRYGSVRPNSMTVDDSGTVYMGIGSSDFGIKELGIKAKPISTDGRYYTGIIALNTIGETEWTMLSYPKDDEGRPRYFYNLGRRKSGFTVTGSDEFLRYDSTGKLEALAKFSKSDEYSYASTSTDGTAILYKSDFNKYNEGKQAVTRYIYAAPPNQGLKDTGIRLETAVFPPLIQAQDGTRDGMIIAYHKEAFNRSDYTSKMDAYIASYNSTGELNWKRNMGNDAHRPYLVSLAVDPKGFIYVVTGRFASINKDTYELTSLDKSGQLRWSIPIESLYPSDLHNSVSNPIIMISAPDGGVFLALTDLVERDDKLGVDKDTQIRVVKISDDSTVQGFSFGGKGLDYASAMVAGKNNELLICGYTMSALEGRFRGGEEDPYVAKFTVFEDPEKYSLRANKLVLEFDEIINPATIKASRFKVRVDGKKVKTSDANVDQDSTFAVLTLPAIVTAGSDVQVSYRDPKKDQNSGVLEDLFGNDVGTFRNITTTVI